MARSRNIKPGFFKNETLAECAPLARLLFAGLWCIADRAGRLEDRPKRIRAEVLPYDDGSVDDMLNDLHRAGFIQRFQVGNERYIQVLNFNKHQSPHFKEAESTIPEPSAIEQCRGGVSDKPRADLVLSHDKPSTSRADSLNLIPDSLNLIPKKHSCSPMASESVDDGFSAFWQEYPRKVAKSKAQKAWKTIKPVGQTFATLMAALVQQKASADWLKDGGKFTPYPATWLSGRRWEDEIASTVQQGKSLLVGASVGNLSGMDYTKGLADV